MQKSIHKTIFKYSLFTFLGLIVLMGITFLAVSLAMPRFIADTAYNMGLNKISEYYYLQTYKQTGEIDDLYNLLNISIINQDDLQIITSFEEIIANSGYAELINEINQETENGSLSVVLKSSLLNEHNYLSNQYVDALVRTNQLEKALDFAKLNFDYNNFMPSNIGNFNFVAISQNLINEDVLLEFNTLYDEANMLIDSMVNYWYNLNAQFNIYVVRADITDLQLSQLIYMRNRITEVGQVLVAYNQVDEEIVPTQEVRDTLVNINQLLSQQL